MKQLSNAWFPHYTQNTDETFLFQLWIINNLMLKTDDKWNDFDIFQIISIKKTSLLFEIMNIQNLIQI